MAGNNFGANQYKKAQITTASRGQVLLLLYEAAIKYVKKATAAIQKKDIAAKGAAIIKAHDIINELMNSLDHNIGGNIARDLERLYNFMTEQLIQANLENSADKLTAVQKLLETLHEGWKGAVEQVNKGTAK